MARDAERIDVKGRWPELYRAGRSVEVVEAGRGAFLTVDGVGEPGGQGYQEAIQKLYTLAYTAKYMLRNAGEMDFGIANLECLWESDPGDRTKSEWTWRLQLRIPEEVTGEHLQRARAAIRERTGKALSGVRRRSWAEGRAVQVLHVGPYEGLPEAYARLGRYAEEHGLRCVGPGHEIYLSDPRRAAPEKLKTIVRVGVKGPAGG